MKENLTGLHSCRVCHSKELTGVGGLGDIAVSNFTRTPQEGLKYPLNLVFCDNCTLLQLEETTPRDLLYSDYWYKSGLNGVIKYDLGDIASQTKGSILDIGCNDGTLLSFIGSNRYRAGVEPSELAWQAARYTDKIHKDYFENASFNRKFDSITAIAMLYDLPEPNAFVSKVTDFLERDGIFISQFQPLSEMIELNDLGNICHEHIEYYSYKSLVTLYEQNGLEIYDVEKNSINGGSYRVFARHFKDGSIDFKEKEYTPEDIQDFFRRVDCTRENFNYFLQEDQPTVYGYGASTKANTILQYYGIKHLKIVDINPDKIGRYPIGTEAAIIDRIPKDCTYLWVFPYGFLDYFKEKESGYKGKWITTIPRFKIT